MAELVDLIPGEQNNVWGQIVEDNIKAVNDEVNSRLWPVDRIQATGRVLNALGTKFLRDDGVWAAPSGGTGGSGTSANALGTMNNPVTDPAAARPTGLTRVVWDCATDPTNWVDNDYNLQKGS